METQRAANGSPLRLGIDGDALRSPLSGVGNYSYHLGAELERLLPDALLFVYSRFPLERLAIPSARWHLRQEPHAALRRLPSFIWLKTRGAAMCGADALDAFWACRTLHPGLDPRRVATISTVHDLNHLIVPETMEWRTRVSHRASFQRDLVRARVVLANSQGTARRLDSMLGVSVHGVVPPGVSPSYTHEKSPDEGALLARLAGLGVTPPYLLSVATLEPRKNVQTLLRAFLVLRRSGELDRHQLVLVGARGWRNRELEAELKAARAEGVLVAGYVDDELMPALYRGADALVCPSLYEGFGMPVLEARACGARVVISDIPELREAGGDSAIVVAPTLFGVIAGCREALVRKRCAEPDVTGPHSWRQRAEGMVEILQNTLPAFGRVTAVA